jgi:hypothetical protein
MYVMPLPRPHGLGCNLTAFQAYPQMTLKCLLFFSHAMQPFRTTRKGFCVFFDSYGPCWL